jgi:hypothetical protein
LFFYNLIIYQAGGVSLNSSPSFFLGAGAGVLDSADFSLMMIVLLPFD